MKNTPAFSLFPILFDDILAPTEDGDEDFSRVFRCDRFLSDFHTFLVFVIHSLSNSVGELIFHSKNRVVSFRPTYPFFLSQKIHFEMANFPHHKLIDEMVKCCHCFFAI